MDTIYRKVDKEEVLQISSRVLQYLKIELKEFKLSPSIYNNVARLLTELDSLQSIESQELNYKDVKAIDLVESWKLNPIQPKQTAALREKISNAFTENSSDANNGQMSVITEDSYSDLINEIIEISQIQPKEISVTDEEIEKRFPINYHHEIHDRGLERNAAKWMRDKLKSNG